MAISSSLLSRSGSLQRRNSRRTAPAFPAPAQLFGSIGAWTSGALYSSTGRWCRPLVPHVQTFLCPPRRRLSRSAGRHRSARRVRRLLGPPPGGEGCIPPGWPGTPRTSEGSGYILRGQGGDRGANSVTAQGGHPVRHHRHDGRGRWLPHRPRRPVARPAGDADRRLRRDRWQAPQGAPRRSRHAARIPGAGSGRVDRRTAGGSRRLGGRQPQHRLHRLTTSQGRRMVQPWWPDCVVQARSTGFVGDRMHI